MTQANATQQENRWREEKNRVECNQLVFHILTGCTHNCRLCVSGVPYYRAQKRSYTARLSDVQFEIDTAFQLFSYVKLITVTGGEPLLHPQLLEVLSYIMSYRNHFGECRVFTNGSILPSEALIQLSKGSGGKIAFVVDDYGEKLSPYTKEIQSKTGCRVNQYYGDSQHFSGWVDYGPLDQKHDYSYEEAYQVISKCHFTDWKMYNIFQGKLFYCTRAAIGTDLGYFELNQDDFLNLRDKTLSVEEMRSKILQLGSKPTKACYYCIGFDTKNSVRYPAAEQIEEVK